MKKIYTLVLFLFTSYLGFTQNYIPLVIDSSYLEVNTLLSDGTILNNTTHAAYSYNDEDLLEQLRQPQSRQNYFYEPNKTIIIAETLEADNTWTPTRRTTLTYANEQLESDKEERFNLGEWSNRELINYFYDEMGQDTLRITFSWTSTDGWEELSKIEKGYDQWGNLIKSETFTSSNGTYIPFIGFRALYDNDRILNRTSLNNNLGAADFQEFSFIAYAYDSEERLDSVTTCGFNNGNCINGALITYDYSVTEQISIDVWDWIDEEWIMTETQVNFLGPEIYSSQPDSTLTYIYEENNPEPKLISCTYSSYTDLGNNEVYYKTELRRFDEEIINDWYLRAFQEIFYRLEMPTNTVESVQPDKTVTVYPNPIKAGERFNIDLEDANANTSEMFEVMVYDMMGRLVISAKLREGATLSAPKNEGLYTLVFLQNGKQIGSSKQMVSN